VGDGRDDGCHANERHQGLAPSHHHQPWHREIFMMVHQSTCFNNPSIIFLNSQYIPEMMQVTRVSLPRIITRLTTGKSSWFINQPALTDRQSFCSIVSTLNDASHQGLTTSQCQQSPLAYEFLPPFLYKP
jgi:hypothetical protein